MEPKFVTRDEFKVAGMECVGTAQSGAFGRLWGEFIPKMDTIPNRSSECGCYGVCGCGPDCEPEKGVCKCQETGASYMACVEVSDTSSVPEGTVARTIPAANYAVFTHKGTLDKLGDTFNYIYQTWLPKSGREMAVPHCFELYDQRFNPVSEDSELDIYVPVK